MNDFLEWFVPCFVTLSLFLMTFGFAIFMRVIHKKEKTVLAEYGLLPEKQSRSWQREPQLLSTLSLVGKVPIDRGGSPKKAEPALQSKTIQARIEKAQSYKTQIDHLIKHKSGGKPHPRLKALIGQVDAWVKAINNLAHRVDQFQQDPLIQRDLESVPQSIAALQKRLADETNPSTRAKLEQTLHNLQKQQSALDQLHLTARQAEIQIESTLSSLGTIYSHILTGQSTNHIADYSQISADVDEEVHRLQDYLEALQEVKLGSVI